LATEIFIPDAYGATKPAPENGVDLWRFLEHVSCALGNRQNQWTT